MAIAGIDPKCYILALFVRDDGVRFLLGDDPYEFKDKQLHFQPNTVANDVVEVQGNDGYLLAGQVRRPGTQSFDGYVCNGTNSKADVEVKRREFLQFFRRSHFYKVIYVFPNGTAIQRKQGFLVDDPTVQELYQQYPEYHVALNFEDVNYYTYEEDDQGQEIYAKEAIVPLAGGGATGGLIWDEYGVVWEDPWSDLVSVSGSEIQIENEAVARAPIQDLELQGDTYQQTYSGKNLFNFGQFYNNRANFGTNVGSITVTENSLQYFGNTSTGSQFYYAQAAANKDIYGMSNLQPSTEYTVSYKATANTQCWIFFFDASNNRTQVQQVFATTDASMSFTTPANMTWYSVRIDNRAVGNNTISELQIETGSTPTDYEPYVGGIPSPNPDYPQAVQTVTGEQTVTVTGKNLFDKNNVNQFMGYFDGTVDNPSLVNGVGTRNRVIYIKCKPSTAYSISLTNRDGINSPQVGTTDSLPSDGLAVTKLGIFESDSLKLENLTTSATAQYIVIRFQTNPSTVRFDDISQALLAGLQIEQGSTATAYEPYKGQSYTVDLGTIELCKIGDYQDEIFNNDPNEDWYDPDLEDNAWYVHKEVNSLSLATIDPWAKTSGGRGFHKVSFSANYGFIAQNQLYSNILLYSPTSWTANGIGINSSGDLWINPGDSTITTSDAFIQWLSSKNAIMYGAITTPTDTQITDTTLIGQLEALGAMRLFIGENNLLVSATGTNLPATLEFSYPTKFATIGAEWEEGGTKGATIVDVNAIDNTYPVWELRGPAVNPTISVLTTNTTLTYNGTITASQKLVIDMFNKTATLNGTSVIGNVSGDFVYMAPGTNRIAYTAENTDAPDSTIYWQEVVG